MASDNNANRKALLKQAGTTYPEVVNASHKSGQRRVNDILRRTAYTAIPDYDPGTVVIEAWSNYKITLNQNGFVSLRFENYFYPETAAHGVTGVSSATLDQDSGYIYDFRQLFRPGSDYQAVINGIIQNRIVREQIALLKPFAGVGPNENYYLTPNSLVIFYQPDVYTAGNYGILEFAIPYRQFAEIIDPRGPAGRILKLPG
jgi:hypothetical protein